MTDRENENGGNETMAAMKTEYNLFLETYAEDMASLARDCATDDQANISIIVNFGVHVGAEQIREWRETV
jgi:hypothetical protein